VTDGDDLAASLSRLRNVSHYSLRGGWKNLRHEVPEPGRKLLLLDQLPLDTLASYLGIEPLQILTFWEKLPHLGAYLPSLHSGSPGTFTEIEARLPEEGSGSAPGASTNLRVAWLSGRFSGPGDVRGRLILPATPPTDDVPSAHLLVEAVVGDAHPP